MFQHRRKIDRSSSSNQYLLARANKQRMPSVFALVKNRVTGSALFSSILCYALLILFSFVILYSILVYHDSVGSQPWDYLLSFQWEFLTFHLKALHYIEPPNVA